MSKSIWSSRHLLEGGGDAEELLTKVARITTWSTESQFVWRGQSDETRKLHSALFDRLLNHEPVPTDEHTLRLIDEKRRTPIQKKRLKQIDEQRLKQIDEQRLKQEEDFLLKRALERGIGGNADVPQLQRWAVLQHHGTATRLMDVSTDPMIALWFATDQLNARGVLFAIEVSRARQYTGTEAQPLHDIVDNLDPDQLAIYWPRPVDVRIQVQRGAFVFGLVPDAIAIRRDTSVPIRIPDWTASKRQAVFGARTRGRPILPTILALRIPKHTKKRLRDILELSYGYTEETIYPDIDGFSRANGRRSPIKTMRR